MKRLLVLVLLLSLAGCAQPMPIEDQRPEASEYAYQLAEGWLQDGLYRFTDRGAGVACWIVREYGAVAISCLPIDQTLLK